VAKVLCAFRPDPATGFPPGYVRKSHSTLTKFPNSQPAPTLDLFAVALGDPAGCMPGERGLRCFRVWRRHDGDDVFPFLQRDRALRHDAAVMGAPRSAVESVSVSES
jgi:hypothetical protein